MSENRGGGFLNGFIFGLLVGGALVFLLGTAKGKRVLQMLLEQVEENTQLSELLEMPDEDEDEYMDAIEEDGSEEELPIQEEKTSNGHREELSKSHKAVAKVKRFFKSAPKKIVS